MMIFFCSRGLEILEIADLIHYKFQTRSRSRAGFFLKMESINREEARQGRRLSCLPGMADWDWAAVDDFLIRLTNDPNLFTDLLWFRQELVLLLRTACLTSYSQPLACF